MHIGLCGTPAADLDGGLEPGELAALAGHVVPGAVPSEVAYLTVSPQLVHVRFWVWGYLEWEQMSGRKAMVTAFQRAASFHDETQPRHTL